LTTSTQTQSEIEKTEDPFIATLQEIKRQTRKYSFLRCLHIDADRFCNYWQINELPKQAEQLNTKEFDYIFKLVKDVGGVKEWALNPLPIICDGCPGFIDDKMIDVIMKKVKNRD
ncbi:MAG: hypothetical protein MUO21_04600, partial [Nitrososphaeraceae archaeon]|nr:hypothetical protein [Nitrososphaeraceae archaeon]